MKRLSVNRKYKVFAEVVSFLYVAFISLVIVFQSDITPFSAKPPECDSSVFRLIGKLITEGYVPYRDAFDHKGPILYLIDALGYFLSPETGVWFMEFFFVAGALCFMYLTARTISGNIVSLISLTFAVYPLHLFWRGGNLAEEYVLLFISIGLWVFSRYFVRNRTTTIELVLCGFAMGGAFLLKPNFVLLWIVMCIAVLVHLIIRKQIQKVCYFIKWFFVGFLSVVVPILFWLIIRGAFGDFINQAFAFNFLYSKSFVVTDISYREYGIRLFFLNPVVLIVLGVSITGVIFKRNIFVVAHFATLVLTIIMCIFTGIQTNQYGIILIPLMVYPFALFSELVKPGIVKIIVVGIVYSIVTVTMAFPNMVLMCENAWNKISYNSSSYTESISTSEDYKVAKYLKDHTDRDEKIIVYGNGSNVYYYADRDPSSKYFYQEPISGIDSNLFEEFCDDIRENTPLYFVVYKIGIRDVIRLKRLLDEMGYRVVNDPQINDLEIYSVFVRNE